MGMKEKANLIIEKFLKLTEGISFREAFDIAAKEVEEMEKNEELTR